jgi:soluble lytic murein transglycosylase-like protein
MSLQAVQARIAELSALLQPAAATAPTASAGSAQFTLPASAASTATAASLTGGGGSSSQYDDLIQAAAQRNGIDPALLKGLIKQESGFDPSAGSPAGAQGLTQLMPGTAAALGVGNPLDPAQSIEGGAKYLAEQLQRFNNDPSLALAAYNAGPGAVQRYGGVPPYTETQNYVRNVLNYAREFRG